MDIIDSESINSPWSNDSSDKIGNHKRKLENNDNTNNIDIDHDMNNNDANDENINENSNKKLNENAIDNGITNDNENEEEEKDINNSEYKAIDLILKDKETIDLISDTNRINEKWVMNQGNLYDGRGCLFINRLTNKKKIVICSVCTINLPFKKQKIIQHVETKKHQLNIKSFRYTSIGGYQTMYFLNSFPISPISFPSNILMSEEEEKNLENIQEIDKSILNHNYSNSYPLSCNLNSSIISNTYNFNPFCLFYEKKLKSNTALPRFYNYLTKKHITYEWIADVGNYFGGKKSLIVYNNNNNVICIVCNDRIMPMQKHRILYHVFSCKHYNNVEKRNMSYEDKPFLYIKDNINMNSFSSLPSSSPNPIPMPLSISNSNMFDIITDYNENNKNNNKNNVDNNVENDSKIVTIPKINEEKLQEILLDEEDSNTLYKYRSFMINKNEKRDFYSNSNSITRDWVTAQGFLHNGNGCLVVDNSFAYCSACPDVKLKVQKYIITRHVNTKKHKENISWWNKYCNNDKTNKDTTRRIKRKISKKILNTNYEYGLFNQSIPYEKINKLNFINKLNKNDISSTSSNTFSHCEEKKSEEIDNGKLRYLTFLHFIEKNNISYNLGQKLASLMDYLIFDKEFPTLDVSQFYIPDKHKKNQHIFGKYSTESSSIKKGVHLLRNHFLEFRKTNKNNHFKADIQPKLVSSNKTKLFMNDKLRMIAKEISLKECISSTSCSKKNEINDE